MEKTSTKECPYCKEDIKVDAIKCKHCGEFLNNNQEKTQENIQNKASGVVVVLGIILIIISGYYFGLIGGGIAGILTWGIGKSNDNEAVKVVAMIIFWGIVIFIGESVLGNI